MAKHEAVGSPVPESLVMGGGPSEDTFSCFSNILRIDPFLFAGDAIGAI